MIVGWLVVHIFGRMTLISIIKSWEIPRPRINDDVMVWKIILIKSIIDIGTNSFIFLERRIISASDKSLFRATMGLSRILSRPYFKVQESETGSRDGTKSGVVSFQAD